MMKKAGEKNPNFVLIGDQNISRLNDYRAK